MTPAPQRKLGLRGGVRVLAVDAGQTEIRAALSDAERGPRSATAPGVLRMGRWVGPEEVAGALLAALAALRPLPEPLPPVGVGLSGFEAAAEDDLRRVGELLREGLSIQRLSIASDGVTSLLGALGGRDGAAVAAGTGSVCVARRGERLVLFPEATMCRFDVPLAPAGSGFQLAVWGFHQLIGLLINILLLIVGGADTAGPAVGAHGEVGVGFEREEQARRQRRT